MNSANAASLTTVLYQHLAERPAAPYLLAADESQHTLSYARIAAAGRWVEQRLRAQGVLPGEHIALLLPGGMATAALSLSLMLTGYVLVPLNLLSPPATLGRIIEHSQARAVFYCHETATLLESALRHSQTASRLQRLFIAADTFPAQTNAPQDAVGPLTLLAPDTPALLMYTSGTTGLPKGVLLSHANLLASSYAIARWHQLTYRDRLLCALPLYHINGLVIGLLVPFVTGGSVVTPRRFSVSAWWSAAQRFRCTWLNLVPTMIAYLLRNVEPSNLAQFAAIRFARSASAPLSPAHHQQFEQRFGIPVVEGMGMTETSSLAFCNPMDRRVYGSVGLPCGTEAAIAEISTGTRLADNQCGEILLRGPGVMKSYYRDARQTRCALDKEGWLHTGDRGYRDERGYYFITGRLKEIIIKGGENIAPREIENALEAHPDILEVAAFAIPDKTYGQEIAAALVIKQGVTFNEPALSDWCAEILGRFRVPARFLLLTELPRGGTGKILRHELCRRYLAQHSISLDP
ncbi:TPA: AMP-binding protein [Raoultella planticola]